MRQLILKNEGPAGPVLADSATPISLWVPLLLGTLLFVALGGLSVLAPSNTGWLLQGFFDPPTNLFGWQYFRETPWLQFPLGANPRYGMEVGSSVVFSDSLPLLALIFKLLDPLLPEKFQYFGLWVLACILLQGIFGYLTLSRFISNRWLLGLGTALLLLLPPYLMRFSIHLALGGQWLLLAGLYLYFSPSYRPRFWLAMLMLATLIHAYLLVMLAAIWGADLLQRLLKRQLTFGQCMVRGLCGSTLVLILMWCLGYFMLGSTPAAPGPYGKMNLLSIIDSGEFWSNILPPLSYEKDFIEGDGFAYMGVGMLGLLAIACLLQFVPGYRKQLDNSTIWPIAATALLLLLISLTGSAKIGGYTLFEIELPQWATVMYQTFRSPGRMFWPVFYLLSVTAIVVTCVRLHSKVAVGVLAVALGIQIYDLSGALKGTRDYFQLPKWETPLTSPLWGHLGERYDKILYVMPRNAPPGFVALTDFAYRHGMTVNSGNFARIDGAAEGKAKETLANQIRTGRYDPKAIYVFVDNDMWSTVLRSQGKSNLVGILNGIKLLLPDAAQCEKCRHEDFEVQRWGVWHPKQLHTIVGQLKENELVARAGTVGYLSFGPYAPIPAGTYRYRISYRANAPTNTVVGHWDIVSSVAQNVQQFARGQLTGTNGEKRVIEGILHCLQDSPDGEIRTYADGNAELALLGIEVIPTDQPVAPPKALAQ